MGARTAERAAAQLRMAMAALAAALLLLLVLLLAYELAAARVPQHRAALEELLRRQTGLEVRFNRLALRWGWYGPEAQFQDVELGELRGSTPLLRARTLVIGLDAWRMVRSGHLEARQIILEYPLIDLTGDGHHTTAAPAQPTDVRRAGARLLGQWRGERVTILAGTLRTVLPGSTEPVTLGISHAQLQRVESHWSADAEVVLPERLGARVHISLQAQSRADPSSPESAEVSLEGRGLELGGWARLSALRGVPHRGRGDIQLQASFLHDELVSASGRLSGAALEWQAQASGGSPLALDHLSARWKLARRDRDWRLRVEALELEKPARAHALPTTLSLEVSPDRNDIHGEALHAPLAPLLSVLRWFVPGLPREGLRLGGEATELSFDWSGARAVGDRLTARADLSSLEVADATGDIRLSGLSGHAAAAEGSLELSLHAHAGQLTLGQDSPALDGLDIETHLDAAAASAGGWRLEARELRVRGEGFGLSASGSIGSPGAHSPPAIDAHLLLSEVDIGRVARLLAQRAPEPWRAAARAVRSGRLESAELAWRGPLTETPMNAASALWAGSLSVRDATLAESDLWPEATGLRARVNWHGAHVQASIGEAHAAGFVLSDGLADWDLRPQHAVHFTGRLAGDAGQLIGWLQSHPRAAAWAPGLSNLDLRGRTMLDLELGIPAGVAPAARSASPRVRLAAFLDGAELRAMPGLPPLEALQGAVTFADGHLQHSSLAARWLGGPATLSVAERREHGSTALLLSGHGVIDVRAATQVAAVDTEKTGLSGSADWSALLSVEGDGGAARWRLHADSSLAGVTSRLPQPFEKSGATVLPLHLDWESIADAAQLRIAVGERLAASAALARNAEGWRIERGAVRLSGAAPALPVESVMLMDGNVGRLDLAAALALWRLASSDPALPPLRARLTASQLLCGASSVADVNITAEAARGEGAVRVRSAGFSASASWSAGVDAAHPALLHFGRFGLGETVDPAAAARIAAALEPAIDLSVEELQWAGHPLGSLSASLAVRDGTLEANELTVSGSHLLIRGSARCLASSCSVAFDLDTDDAAAALVAFGYDPELSAREGHIEARLRWLPQASAPLATLDGNLHLQFDDGNVSPAAAPAADSFPLLSVPALLSAIETGAKTSPTGRPALRFARLSGEYQLSDGAAVTSSLHMDGEAEILVRGRVGLAAGDYDERAWVLRGADRLPAPVRHFAPRPAVAAVWLSLRDLLGIDGPAQARAALHLRGPWSDPIVTEAE